MNYLGVTVIHGDWNDIIYGVVVIVENFSFLVAVQTMVGSRQHECAKAVIAGANVINEHLL